ncbi:MAG TPA: phytoene desaturase [Vicinamibacteria bacterium]
MSDRASRTRAAVIGSGFGGLATAIRLQARGVRTVVFEKRDLPGGRAYVYRDRGYTFDAGPTVITAPPCLEELFAVAGRKMSDSVEMLPVRPFYRLSWPDGVSFDYAGEQAGMEEQIRRLSPGDVVGYRSFVEYARQVFEKGYEELAGVPFLRFADMVKVAPDLVRLRADRSVYGVVSRFVEDDHLRQALSFHSLLVGGNPFETSAIYTLIHYLERKWGVFFPRGGTGALVRALVKLYEEIGGEIRLSTPVRRIDAPSGPGSAHRVVTDAGEEAFDVVVSNADVHHTYKKLYGHDPRGRRYGRRLERMDWSMSLFLIYFGTSRRWPELAHHTVVFGPRYEGLLRDIFHGSALPEDFSLYLHAPTITDPSMAPPGGEAFYVLSPVPHLGLAKVDWAKAGPAYADRILELLEERLVPGLRASVVTRRLFTPVDFRDELNTFEGSAFSVAPKLTQSAWFRPLNRDPRIPGLYIAGAGTHPGAGLPGVVNSAKATDRVIAEDLGL